MYERPPGYYRARDLSENVNKYYDAAKEGTLGALKTAYENQTAGYSQAADKLRQAYDAARNTASADSAIANYNLNQRLAGDMIGSGAGAQARLSQQNALMRRYSDIDRQNLDAQGALETAQASLQRNYQSAIASAIEKNRMDRAKALYDEAVRYDKSFTEFPVQTVAAGGAPYSNPFSEDVPQNVVDMYNSLKAAQQAGAGPAEILKAIAGEYDANHLDYRNASELTSKVLNESFGNPALWKDYSARYSNDRYGSRYGGKTIKPGR